MLRAAGGDVPDRPVMSILGKFLALRTTTVMRAAAGWKQTETRISPLPWSFSWEISSQGNVVKSFKTPRRNVYLHTAGRNIPDER